VFGLPFVKVFGGKEQKEAERTPILDKKQKWPLVRMSSYLIFTLPFAYKY
jgi:hypothetical protein